MLDLLFLGLKRSRISGCLCLLVPTALTLSNSRNTGTGWRNTILGSRINWRCKGSWSLNTVGRFGTSPGITMIRPGCFGWPPRIMIGPGSFWRPPKMVGPGCFWRMPPKIIRPVIPCRRIPAALWTPGIFWLLVVPVRETVPSKMFRNPLVSEVSSYLMNLYVQTLNY